MSVSFETKRGANLNQALYVLQLETFSRSGRVWKNKDSNVLFVFWYKWELFDCCTCVGLRIIFVVSHSVLFGNLHSSSLATIKCCIFPLCFVMKCAQSFSQLLVELKR